MKSLSLAAAGAVGLVVLAFGATLAHAAFVALPDNGEFSTTAEDGSGTWKVNYAESADADTLFKLEWDATDQVLKKTVTFSALAPKDITFTQTTDTTPVAPNTKSRFGLRFKMQGVIKNMTPAKWTAFQDKLIDMSIDGAKPATPAQADFDAGDAVRTDTHPRNSHFHDDATVIKVGEIGFNTKQRVPAVADGIGFSIFNFFNGPGVAVGDTWMPSRIGIHDWEVTAFRRKFVLREQPNVPEPSVLVLVALASLAAAGQRRRRT
jgi:hypothetical protein